MLSNGVTNIDSVTKFEDYVSLAKAYGMTALGGSEHGSVFMHGKRKDLVESAGMKYVHSAEAYITMTLEEKIRDSYHCILIAKNYEGFKEINRLVSRSFTRKNDNHFYYVPRISFDELEHTSDNIIVTSACLGGILASNVESHRQRFIQFAVQNSDRVYLEIQHHNVPDQIKYNLELWDLAIEYDLKLIAGTDTHSLNETHAKGRAMLQKGKGVHFEDEEGWDLVFKSYEELCYAYRMQNALPEAVWREAIENTNIVADQIEPFKVDNSIKYPNVFADPDAEFETLAMSCIDSHPYALKNHSREELAKRVHEELDTYKKIGATPYMLLKYNLSQWEKKNNINIGYGRGSVNGSMIAYLLGVTDMDSMRFNLNFFRR